MLILAVDTSGRQGGIAVARGDATEFELIDSSVVVGGTFSAQLVPAIAQLLARHGIPKTRLEGLAAASGPGSFTGLRVGLAAVKALGETLQKPIAAVSILEACADLQRRNAGWSTIYVALDASRGDVFLGRFEVAQNRLRCLDESLLSMPEFVQCLREQPRDAMLCSCDETVLHALENQGIRVTRIPRPASADIARLGAKKIADGEITSPEALDANYIRRAEFTKTDSR